MHTVDPKGMSGGLILLYDLESTVNIIYKSNGIIDIETMYNGKIKFLTLRYGDHIDKLRDQVWERLTRIGINRSDPCFVIGDINEITCDHEKQGGLMRHASTFLHFNNI